MGKHQRSGTASSYKEVDELKGAIEYGALIPEEIVQLWWTLGHGKQKPEQLEQA